MDYQQVLHVKVSVVYAVLYQRGAECDHLDTPIMRNVEYNQAGNEFAITKESTYRYDGQWCFLWTLINQHEGTECISDAPIEITGTTIKANGLYTYGPAINSIRWSRARQVQEALNRHLSVLEFTVGIRPNTFAIMYQFGNTEVVMNRHSSIHCQGYNSAIKLFDHMIDLVESVAARVEL